MWNLIPSPQFRSYIGLGNLLQFSVSAYSLVQWGNSTYLSGQIYGLQKLKIKMGEAQRLVPCVQVGKHSATELLSVCRILSRWLHGLSSGLWCQGLLPQNGGWVDFWDPFWFWHFVIGSVVRPSHLKDGPSSRMKGEQEHLSLTGWAKFWKR